MMKQARRFEQLANFTEAAADEADQADSDQAADAQATGNESGADEAGARGDGRVRARTLAETFNEVERQRGLITASGAPRLEC